MMIENRMSPETEGVVAPEPSILKITERNQSLCFENHELTNSIMQLLTGQPITPPPALAISNDKEMSIKAMLMNQTEIMISTQRLLKQLAEEMYA